ncbi:uncharacterized protein LOC126370212 isoform X2 [Pectinophora gossypiella]|uniref:uncharacterized protein LOC126370212 isoform X2 n=1 Tax=Pectinophora gossypiella TaxID=13191 RepID=UPI00214EE0A5|nr:uncharacterized protein LOC126370212 isoform X2 [Pectinophora gossypiella]
MAEQTTMGQLAAVPCEDEEDKSPFQAIVYAVEELFPKGWRSWKVFDYSFKDVFGDEISQNIDAKVRFAIPITVLARAFDLSAQSVSERRFRAIKSRVLRWPLGRALLYAPHNIMEKIHEPDYQAFMDTVKELKPALVNRHKASCQLRGVEPDGSFDDSVSSVSQKRHSTSSLDDRAAPKRVKAQEDSNQLLAAVLNKQMEMFDRLLNVSTEQNENIKKLLSQTQDCPKTDKGPDLNESFESVPDSTNSDEEMETGLYSAESITKRSITSNSRESVLRDQIVEAQRQLAALQSGEDIDDDTREAYTFAPFTIEKEPKIARADPDLLKQGIECQRFCQESWRNIRYADTQKMFQASPAFSCLKTNNILASATPSYKSVNILEKFDLTLGAVTNGLLQQRKCFQELLDKLPRETRHQVGKYFLAADSNFRKVSDNLLQYVCGRRAEVIQQRRESYRPTNKVLKQILHDIPPSETHLFMDKTLTEVIKEQGGIYKFFPARKKFSSPTNKSGHDWSGKRENPKPSSNPNAKGKRPNNNYGQKWNTASKGKSGQSTGRTQNQQFKKKGEEDRK